MKKLASLTSALVALATVSFAAQAAVISGAATSGSAFDDGGVFVNLGFNPPAEVGEDNQQSLNLFAFNEDQNITISGPVNVDFCSVVSSCGSGSLATGTVVASHYVYFDPEFTRRMIGTVTFDADILAVMDETTNLSASDFLANNSVIYNSPNLRGLEAGDDSYTVSGATISINFRASTPGDYIRVLTAFSPVAAALPGPGAIALLGLGLFGLGAMRRKKTI